MDENPYQAPAPSAAFPSVAPPTVSLLRQLLSAVFLAIGLIFTLATTSGFAFLTLDKPVRGEVTGLVELGLIAVVCYAVAYRIQRPRRAEPP